MSWVAAGVGLATTAASITAQQVAAHKAAAAKKKAEGALAGSPLGHVPEAAQYQPLDFTAEQMRAITANRDSIPLIEQLTSNTNKYITNDALRRVRSLVPNYDSSMRNLGSAAGNLTGGELPFDDLESIIGHRGESSNALGIPGLAGPATKKDLGLSSLDAINQGSGLLGKMVSIAEQVSPRGSYLSPKDSMISPSERIRNTIEQNQLIQQSDQGVNNAKAGADPNKVAMSQLLLSQALNGGGNAGGLDASTIQQIGGAATSLAGSVNKWGENTGRWGANAGYDSTSGMYRSPDALNSAYATPGYTPVYGSQNGQNYFQYYKPVEA